MIICNMESMVMMIPRPPALPPAPPLPPPMLPNKSIQQKNKKQSPSVKSKSSTTSQGFRLMEDQGDTGSVYSIYKQKIDAMFEPSDSQNTKNPVQARIEKMFTDVAKDNGIPLIESSNVIHSFSVDYLGSIPLKEKVTSLSGLQDPLRDLYFAYKRTTKLKKSLTGRLEISGLGLKVQYQGEKGDLEQTNSFPTIAVWSAVKFVIQDKPRTYAFLPLITDPDNIDKRTLFRNLEENESKYIDPDNACHSPLFAVVMRKIGVHKQLECHGFVCQTSEDAIVIAATLYKSLMSHVKTKESGKPKSRNGITTCMSVASSAPNDAPTPVRPPRKKRSTASSMTSEISDISETRALLIDAKPKKSVKTRRAPKPPDDVNAIVPYEEATETPEVKEIKPKKFSTYMSREQKQITAEIKQKMSESTRCGLKHVEKDDQNVKGKKDNSGDILTKVTIPRSGSFLNAGGLTRYKSKMSRGNGYVTGGSPLGFNELFNEFRLQEGLHSMDEILGVIIDPEGMSFNDLKPIYKEFLLKLSVTLTKDELYQRSKLIMRRQKKKLLRRSSTMQTTNKQTHRISVSGKFKRLKHIFQKNFKLSKIDKNDFDQAKIRTDPKLPESSISTSSYDTRQFTPREESAPLKRPSYRKKPETLSGKNRRDRLSTSEESDFFSMRRKNNKDSLSNVQNQNRNSSSGYVSCSECSYDSDTCTCTSADKCYCSLGGNHNTNNNNNKNKRTHRKTRSCDCQNELVFCGCDTDSCAESNKCYCQIGTKNDTILEQLKRRGLIPNDVHINQKHKKLCKKASNTKSTRSLEYMPNPAEAIYYEKLGKKRRNSDNLGLDYELFSRNARNRALYSSALSESNRIKYEPRTGCTEALSVKKSAEMAALFADVRLSQTTDIAHLMGPNRNVDSRSESAVSQRNAYNDNRFRAAQNYYHSQRIVQNALYVRNNGPNRTNDKMYSARNGLYTIQSQSDESRRSSLSETGDNNRNKATTGRRIGQEREYFELEPQFGAKNRNSSTLENSLGYLP